MKKISRFFSNIFDNNEAVALIMAIYIIVIFIILAVVMTAIMLSVHTSSSEYLASTRAYYTAQSGSGYALYELRNLDDWATKDNSTETKSLDSAGAGSSNYPKFTISYDYPVVGAWEFNDVENMKAASETQDVSGNGNYAEFVGGTNYASSKGTLFGKSLYFDGWQDYLVLNNSFRYFPNGITISCWIRTNDWTGIIISYDRSEIFRLGVGSSGTSGRVTWNTDAGTDFDDMSGSTIVSDNNWYFVVADYNPDDSQKNIYVYNSSCTRLEKSTKSFGGPGQSLGDGTTRYGFIGTGSEASSKDGSRGPSHYYRGYLDSLRIFDVAFGEDEIADFCNTSYPVPYDIRRYLIVELVGKNKYGGSSSFIANRKIKLTVPRND